MLCAHSAHAKATRFVVLLGFCIDEYWRVLIQESVCNDTRSNVEFYDLADTTIDGLRNIMDAVVIVLDHCSYYTENECPKYFYGSNSEKINAVPEENYVWIGGCGTPNIDVSSAGRYQTFSIQIEGYAQLARELNERVSWVVALLQWCKCEIPEWWLLKRHPLYHKHADDGHDKYLHDSFTVIRVNAKNLASGFHDIVLKPSTLSFPEIFHFAVCAAVYPKLPHPFQHSSPGSEEVQAIGVLYPCWCTVTGCSAHARVLELDI